MLMDVRGEGRQRPRWRTVSDRRIERLRENVEEALRALEMTSRTVQLAMECEGMAREILRQARVELKEQRALDQREQRHAKTVHHVDPDVARNQGGLPARPKKRSAFVASPQSRGLWKPSPIEADHAPRHHLVKDELPRAPLARLSHDDARDLWNN